MTYAKFGTEFPAECARDQLTDAAFRLHVEAVMYLYSVEQMSLTVPKHMLRRISGTDEWQPAADELVKRGYWKDKGCEYLIQHHGNVVRASLLAQRAKRKRDAEAQRAHRSRHPKVSDDVSADVSADVNTDLTDRQTVTKGESFAVPLDGFGDADDADPYVTDMPPWEQDPDE